MLRARQINGYLCRVWYRGQPIVSNLCNVQGHKAAVCPNKDNCRRCGEQGHFARNCSKNLDPSLASSGDDQAASSVSSGEGASADPIPEGVVSAHEEPGSNLATDGCVQNDRVVQNNEGVSSDEVVVFKMVRLSKMMRVFKMPKMKRIYKLYKTLLKMKSLSKLLTKVTEIMFLVKMMIFILIFVMISKVCLAMLIRLLVPALMSVKVRMILFLQRLLVRLTFTGNVAMIPVTVLTRLVMLMLFRGTVVLWLILLGLLVVARVPLWNSLKVLKVRAFWALKRPLSAMVPVIFRGRLEVV